MFYRGNYIAWFLILALAAVLWLPNLFAKGMFMDGVYDALLAENLYKGISTFWSPQATSYSNPAYWDNPPLSMGLLASFYKILGDHYWVERIYSLLCAVIQLILIAGLWKVMFVNNKEVKKYAWLPCLLWLVSPLIGWSYSNNLMENTMSIFTTAAIIAMLKYVHVQRGLLFFSALTAGLILLAFITKGPVSLFPLVFPLIVIGVEPGYNLKRGLLLASVTTFFFFLFFTVLFSFNEPANFIRNYYEVQLKRALTHDMDMVYKPYGILIELVIATSPFLLLSAVRFFMRNRFTESLLLKKYVWRFVVLGLCGSVPIMLSIKQSKFYLLPVMPVMSVGFAAYLLPMILWGSQKANGKMKRAAYLFVILGCIGVTLYSLTMCYNNRGEIVRDELLLGDLEEVNRLTGNDKVIGVGWSIYGEWALWAYWYRLYGKKISFPDEAATVNFYMIKVGRSGDGMPPRAQKIFSGEKLELYSLHN